MALTAKQIKYYREIFGITQGELAEILGISSSTVGAIERGERKLSEIVAEKATAELLTHSYKVQTAAKELQTILGKEVSGMTIDDRADELLFRALQVIDNDYIDLKNDIVDYLFGGELTNAEYATEHLTDEEIEYFTECERIEQDVNEYIAEIEREDGDWD